MALRAYSHVENESWLNLSNFPIKEIASSKRQNFLQESPAFLILETDDFIETTLTSYSRLPRRTYKVANPPPDHVISEVIAEYRCETLHVKTYTESPFEHLKCFETRTIDLDRLNISIEVNRFPHLGIDIWKLHDSEYVAVLRLELMRFLNGSSRIAEISEDQAIDNLEVSMKSWSFPPVWMIKNFLKNQSSFMFNY